MIFPIICIIRLSSRIHREVWRQFDSEENGRKSLKFRKKRCGIERREYRDHIFAWISINFGGFFLMSWTRRDSEFALIIYYYLITRYFSRILIKDICIMLAMLFIIFNFKIKIQRPLYLIFDNRIIKKIGYFFIVINTLNTIAFHSFLNFHLTIEFHKVQ